MKVGVIDKISGRTGLRKVLNEEGSVRAVAKKKKRGPSMSGNAGKQIIEVACVLHSAIWTGRPFRLCTMNDQATYTRLGEYLLRTDMTKRSTFRLEVSNSPPSITL